MNATKYRLNGRNPQEQGAKLFRQGYRQVSRAYGMIARIPGKVELAGPIPKTPEERRAWTVKWQQQDHERRMRGEVMEGVPDDVMKAIRMLTDLELRRNVRGIVDLVAICVDNSGMEDLFDLEIEYIREPDKMSCSPEMIDVYDNFGNLRTCYRKRFRTKVVAE